MSESAGLELSRILELVDEVPAISAFPLVDELIQTEQGLAGALPARVRRRRIGTSRLGEPIHVLTVGDGPRHAVILGGVHPNEPIGGPTALHLARLLAEQPEVADALGYTWHIAPCVDPDGMRLNEGWFSGKLNRAEYGRQFYRPQPDEQVEWTFPLAFKDVYFDRVMPETLGMMRLIDDVRPTFLCSLHNGEFGGVYYYVSEPAPELYPALHAVPDHLGIPIDRGEATTPFSPVLAAGIFGSTSIEKVYEARAALGLEKSDGMDSGTSSVGYARRHGAFGLISELPYWSHPDAADETPTATQFSEVLRGRADGLHDLGSTLGDVLASSRTDLIINSPHLRALRQFIPHFVDYGDQEEKRSGLPEHSRPATVAEVFTGADLVHGFRMRYGGMMLRTLEVELVAGHGTPRIRDAYKAMSQTYDGWAAEALKVTPPETLPIRTLVGVQLGAILAGAAHAADRFGPGSPYAETGGSY